ncbi:MAG: hypothetical protein WCO44_01095 [Bacteroidota bacterium]
MHKQILAWLLLLCPFANLEAQTVPVKQAEDLWGSRIPFGRIIRSPRTTVIKPFSPSNCGYCMFDGGFTAENYFETNRAKGGANFTQCLFNPQLDIYAFTKQYRDSLTPVLTWPPDLHQYHRDGFPVILAFRKGKQIVGLPEGSLFPYDSSFEQLKMTLWNDTTVHFKPVSGLQFATRIIYENMRYAAVCVVADNNRAAFDGNREFAARAKCFSVKYLSGVNPADLRQNILLEGKFPWEVYRLVTGEASPFRLESDSVFSLGRYRFGIDSVGISACMPNPLDPEKYMVMKIRGAAVEQGFFDNSVDYSVYSWNKVTKSTRILLHGFFDRNQDNRWIFTGSRCISHLPVTENCTGVCTVPKRNILPGHPVVIRKPVAGKTAAGTRYTFGRGSCRFPSIVADDKGTVWVCWEEKGDILLSQAGQDPQAGIAVEHDRSDSYNPLITCSGGKIWIFYLNNRDGFYRVYARSYDGTALTEPVLCTERLPCEVVTPCIVSTKSGIVLAWSYWKANSRYPFFRRITDGIPDSIHPVSLAPSPSLPGYSNGWSFSLDADGSGRVWGAWNQHYPATLGVCSGYLDEESVSVTQVNDDIEKCENGGYPSVVHDEEGRRWVFWESFAWDVPDGGRQEIHASTFDPVIGRWGNSVTLPSDDQTIMNQTPQAVTTPDGRILVTWSGRSKRGNWTLYLSTREKGAWSAPIKVTSGKEAARAPKIICDPKTGIWIAWHAGEGDKMKIRVLQVAGKAGK